MLWLIKDCSTKVGSRRTKASDASKDFENREMEIQSTNQQLVILRSLHSLMIFPNHTTTFAGYKTTKQNN